MTNFMIPFKHKGLQIWEKSFLLNFCRFGGLPKFHNPMIFIMKKNSVCQCVSPITTNIVGGLVGMVTLAIVPRALGPTSYGNFTFVTKFFQDLISFYRANSRFSDALFCYWQKRFYNSPLFICYVT